MPTYQVATWYGLWAPKGTPKDAIDRMNAELKKAFASKEIRDAWTGLGAETAHPHRQRLRRFRRRRDDALGRGRQGRPTSSSTDGRLPTVRQPPEPPGPRRGLPALGPALAPATRAARACRRRRSRAAGTASASPPRRSAPAGSGARTGRPRLPRRQQPEAGRLPGRRRWRRSIRRGCTTCTWCSRCWRCPSTSTSSRAASPRGSTSRFSGPQGARLAQAGVGRADRDRRDPHLPRTVRALLRRPDAAGRAGRRAGGRRATATSTPAPTPRTRRPSSRPPHSRAAS